MKAGTKRWYATVEEAIANAIEIDSPIMTWVGKIRYRVFPSGKVVLLEAGR